MVKMGREAQRILPKNWGVKVRNKNSEDPCKESNLQKTG